MDQVPKILKPMVDEWTPEGFVVSFKVCTSSSESSLFDALYQLETDPALLVPKARVSLERYGHQVVIGNELHRRKFEVVFVYRSLINSGNSGPDNSGFEETWLRIDEVASSEGKEIEEDIITELVARHLSWIKSGSV